MTVRFVVVISDESGSDSDGADSTSSSYSSLSDFVTDMVNSEIDGDTPCKYHWSHSAIYVTDLLSIVTLTYSYSDELFIFRGRKSTASLFPFFLMRVSFKG